ncbi:MAG: hypothetical protein HXY40_04300 [Chloroflexi bacterium]|nr:hypothetical protein [Chloroflexota bacterium]
MNHLATVFPALSRVRRLPLTRDQLMLLLAAVNQIFLAIDIYLAHSISGVIQPNEWIPIIFGALAGAALLLAGLIALANRPLATVIANAVLLASIVVGLMGVYFHLVRAGIIGGGSETGAALNLLVWAPPFLGPLAFALVGALGISAAWIEDPADSGRLRLFGQRHVQMPYSKTRAYFLIVSLFALITVISSTLDHARSNFANPSVWLPAVAGVFATASAVTLGFIAKPTATDVLVYTLAMLVMIVIGLLGFLLHLNTNLVAQNTILVERFIRGSPLLAPLLYANVGLLGLVALLDPAEK